MVNRSTSLPYKLSKRIAKIPGVVETYVQINDIFGRSPRFDSCWRKLLGWLKELERAQAGGGCATKPGKRVLFFTDLPTHVDYSLAMAVLLLSRGVRVDFAWLSHAGPQDDVGKTIGYPYWRRSGDRMHGRELHPNLRLIDLTKRDPVSSSSMMREIATRQAQDDTSYVLLRERIHPESDERDRAVLEYRLCRNLDAMTRVASLLRENKYDRVILNNGAILEYGAVYRFVESEGLPITTFENQNNGTIFISDGASVMSMDLSKPWSDDEPHILTDERRLRVQRLIEQRQRPAPRKVTLEYLQLAEVTSAEQTRSQLKLPLNQPIALMCPNCAFDAAYYVKGKRSFSAMWQWLVDTVAFFIDRTDCQLVVRSHPAEAYYQTGETTASILKEYHPHLPTHIHLVMPEDPISTYALMDIASLGLVYWSTTGLEMAMRGIPVVCGVPAVHYNGKGFTFDPENRDEYYRIIDRILHDSEAARLTPRQIELARCYADVYFITWPKPFPWRPGRKFWPDIKEWPISRVLSTEGEMKYGEMIDMLLGADGLSRKV
jgi:hypothetical protein